MVYTLLIITTWFHTLTLCDSCGRISHSDALLIITTGFHILTLCDGCGRISHSDALLIITTWFHTLTLCDNMISHSDTLWQHDFTLWHFVTTWFHTLTLCQSQQQDLSFWHFLNHSNMISHSWHFVEYLDNVVNHWMSPILYHNKAFTHGAGWTEYHGGCKGECEHRSVTGENLYRGWDSTS